MIKTFEVLNIKCSGCATTITKELEKEGFKDIKIDLSCEPRKVTIDIENEASLAHVRMILRKLGYPFSDEEMSFSNSTTLKVKSMISCAVGKFNIDDNTK
jgi:copper chaperone